MTAPCDTKKRTQLALSLAMWALAFGLFLGIYGASLLPWTSQWIARQDLQNWKDHKRRGRLSGAFAGTLNRLTLEGVYQPDFTRKKVYMIGTCNVEDFLDDTQVPAAQMRDIWMLAFARCDMINLKSIVDWLQRDFGLGKNLAKGSMFVVGVNADDAAPHNDPFFRTTFEGVGLYDYSKDDVIHTRNLIEPLKYWRLVRGRTANFIIRMKSLSSTQRMTVPKKIYPDLDDSWVPRQLTAFRQMLDALIATGATVKVVFYPTGSWLDTPRRREIRGKIMDICQQYKLETLDLSKVAPDNTFMDDSHLSPDGVKITHPLVYPMIQPAFSEK